MDPIQSIASIWIEALARRDFDQLESLLVPDVRFRALVPGEQVAVVGAREAVACYRRWFGDKVDFELLDSHAGMLVDRAGVRFRARVRRDGCSYVVDQVLWGDMEHGRFVTFDLVCSGFRPEGSQPAGASKHLFDAGDLGCGTGLPREFRTRLAQIPVGHVLEVVTRDASAKEDLPSMARLLGHTVRSVETGSDGRHIIQVERTQ